jgi:integrase
MTKALTVAALSRLKPNPDKRIERPDGLIAGLYFIIQPSGVRSWAVRYRAGGRTRKLTLGGYPTLSLEKAREEARDALLAAKRGADPAAAKAAQKREEQSGAIADRLGFDGVARRYLARDAKGNRSWIETARLLGLRPTETAPTDPAKFEAVKDGIVSAWSKRLIGEIGRGDVIDRLDRIIDRGSPIAANRTLAALRRLFNWAIERGLIDKSPCAGVKPPGEERSRDRVLSDQEARWMWLAADSLGYPFGPVAQLLLVTGQRRDEVADMTRGEIEGDVWTIPRDRAKNDVAHAVPLPELALGIVEKLTPTPGAAGYLFTTTGEAPVSGWSRFKTNLDAKMLEIARQETQNPDLTIAGWTLHDLRRSCASGMASLGMPVHVVEKHLNHRSGTISGVAAVYLRHSYWTERVNAAKAWAEHLERIVAGASPASNVTPFPKRA